MLNKNIIYERFHEINHGLTIESYGRFLKPTVLVVNSNIMNTNFGSIGTYT